MNLKFMPFAPVVLFTPLAGMAALPPASPEAGAAPAQVVRSAHVPGDPVPTR